MKPGNALFDLSLQVNLGVRRKVLPNMESLIKSKGKVLLHSIPSMPCIVHDDDHALHVHQLDQTTWCNVTVTHEENTVGLVETS